MKKKILIVFTGALELGGIERSLIGLLNVINYDEYEVDLFLYGHHGQLFDSINRNVNILPEVKELACLRESLITKIKNGCYYASFLRIKDAIKSKFCYVDQDRTWGKIIDRFCPYLTKSYDLAIGFFLPFDCIKLKCIARKKIGWIHTDYKGEKANRTALLKEYIDLDNIVAVSDSCADTFSEIFPQLKPKIVKIENILSKNQIQKDANAFKVDHIYDSNKINVLSIGRFCEAKNFDNIPEICKKIRDKGLDVVWYLIGFGTDEKLIRKKIKEFNMERYVIVLGKQENPYPYIKNCDVYIQPSRYEGKCVAVREAQILEKPVIITNYATAASQLISGYDGMIVPMNNEECANGVYEVLKNKKLLDRLSYNCSQNDYTNSNEINKLYKLLS